VSSAGGLRERCETVDKLRVEATGARRPRASTGPGPVGPFGADDDQELVSVAMSTDGIVWCVGLVALVEAFQAVRDQR